MSDRVDQALGREAVGRSSNNGGGEETRGRGGGGAKTKGLCGLTCIALLPSFALTPYCPRNIARLIQHLS